MLADTSTTRLRPSDDRVLSEAVETNGMIAIRCAERITLPRGRARATITPMTAIARTAAAMTGMRQRCMNGVARDTGMMNDIGCVAPLGVAIASRIACSSAAVW